MMAKSLGLGLWFTLTLFASAAAWASPDQADPRYASVVCSNDDASKLVNCDYRHSAGIDVKDVSLKIAGKPSQIDPKNLSVYPANGQTTAILFLVDVSDPKRRNTVEKKNVAIINEMLAAQKPYEKVGIAVFDSDLEVLVPISSDQAATKEAVKNIKASGQATEFYKNILSAIEILKKTDATRKGLVILSDGKDEDRAYMPQDVVNAAKTAGVVILSLGYLEKPTDSPYLQNLQRLADDTFGVYYNATDSKLPPDFATQPFSFVEKGGRVSFPYGDNIGKQPVTIVLGTKSNKGVDLTTDVDFPDNRSSFQKAIDFCKSYWIELLVGLIVFIALSISIFLLIRRIRRNKPVKVVYAQLDEMDGLDTRHELTKTASTIGRSPDNDIQLSNDSISSHHAEIHRRREGDFYIVDLASSNGVYVNGNRVTQVELHDGDLIELGEVRLHFYTT
jgi:Mg-chelatase subunit ChlD